MLILSPMHHVVLAAVRTLAAHDDPTRRKLADGENLRDLRNAPPSAFDATRVLTVAQIQQRMLDVAAPRYRAVVRQQLVQTATLLRELGDEYGIVIDDDDVTYQHIVGKSG